LASKVKKISFFFLVFTFSFLAGSFFFFFENFGFLSLKSYVLETPSAEIESRFWESLPPRCLRYWPVLVYKSSHISVLMEKTVPVQVSTEAKGVGLFHTRISYLEPWLMIEWKGNTWYLSKEGYMWAPELYTFKVPRSPIWRISETLNRYFGIDKSVIPDGVFPAMFSVEELRQFDGIFRVQSWYADTKYIDFDRRAGEFVLKLSLDLNGKMIVLLINGEENKLSEIDMILKQIMPQIDLDDKETFIDMSYTDKIVVTRAREGSLK
jgi:hypothetical protein